MEPAPQAVRAVRPGWRDVRIWAGLALVAVAAVLGARVMGERGHVVQVWQAVRDLPAGQAIDMSAVQAVTVSQATADMGYLPAQVDVSGMMTRPVAAGELLPSSAVGSVDWQPTRHVTVPVDEGHFPVGLAAGDRVDVWVSTGQSNAPGVPREALADAHVAAVSEDGFGLAGQIAVELDVPDAAVADVVAAVRGGVVDLVSVPIDGRTMALGAEVAP